MSFRNNELVALNISHNGWSKNSSTDNSWHYESSSSTKSVGDETNGQHCKDDKNHHISHDWHTSDHFSVVIEIAWEEVVSPRVMVSDVTTDGLIVQVVDGNSIAIEVNDDGLCKVFKLITVSHNRERFFESYDTEISQLGLWTYCSNCTISKL